MPIHGERQIGQRVVTMSVDTALRDQHLRPERTQQRRHHSVESTQPWPVFSARWQRQIDRGAMCLPGTQFTRVAGAGATAWSGAGAARW